MSRTVTVGIGALASAVLAGVVVAVVLVASGGEGELAVSASSSPTVDAPRRRIVVPDTLAGRPQARDRHLRDLDLELIMTLKAMAPSVTSVDARHYGSTETNSLIAFGAATGTIRDPTRTLDHWFDSAFKLSNFASTDPGPLGGVAECGQGMSGGMTVHACGWAHEESIGFVYFYEASAAEVPAQFVQIRNQVEQRT